MIKYKNIISGSRIRWNLEMGPTYRSHIWIVRSCTPSTFIRGEGCNLQKLSKNGMRLLEDKRWVDRERIERFGTLI